METMSIGQGSEWILKILQKMLASRQSGALVRQMIAVGHCLLLISHLSAKELRSVTSKTSSPSTSSNFQFGLTRGHKDTEVHWTRKDAHKLSKQTGGELLSEVEKIKSVEGRRRKLPVAIIIGVKKAGTRALLEFLKVHPDIRAPGPEIHFFDRQYHRGLEWYRSRMPATLDGQLTIEKTPSYFVTRSAPERVYSMSPDDVRLIVVVRDPVTRALSDYTQTRLKRPDLPSFEAMAFGNASDRHGQMSDDRSVNISWGAVRIGLYERYLSRWLRFFSIDRFHFVNGERLVADPAGELGRLQDFLGVKTLVTDKHFYYNATKGFPCLKKSERSGAPRCLGQSKGRSHPVVSAVDLQRLRDFYRPFNRRFYELTGINFGWY